jgi:hypothetical protein
MTPNETDVIPAEILADLEEAARYAATGVGNPEALRRVAAQAARIREEIRQQHGVLEVAVALVRETRAEA